MYDYRSMTIEDRIHVLELRRERGFPLHAPPRVHEDGDFHISVACYEHTKHFDNPRLLSWLADEILGLLRSLDICCPAWCFLPNHYHVSVRDVELRSLGEAIRKCHGRISTKLNGQQGQRGRRVWYRFTDRAIRSERHYWTIFNYIHYNPVKHGYVDDMREWSWSSFPDYREQFGDEWLEMIWKAYPVLDYGKTWDIW